MISIGMIATLNDKLGRFITIRFDEYADNYHMVNTGNYLMRHNCGMMPVEWPRIYETSRRLL